MTGAFLRAKRDGRWVNIEVEHMTDGEREEAFLGRTPVELVRWIHMLCHALGNARDPMLEEGPPYVREADPE